MRQIADSNFIRESSEFSLRASCEHCVYFEPDSELCTEGYPNAEHRRLPVLAGELLCFCKMFELV
jgi:hypothetical protein